MIRKGEHKKQKQFFIRENLHNFDWRNFKILVKESNRLKKDISEMVHINIQNKSINKQEDTLKLSKMHTNVLHKFKCQTYLKK